MESFKHAFYILFYIALVVFFIRFLAFISEQIGFYNFINKCVQIFLEKWNKKI